MTRVTKLLFNKEQSHRVQCIHIFQKRYFFLRSTSSFKDVKDLWFCEGV